MSNVSRWGGAAVIAAAALLAGCATGYVLDNRVQSFSALPAVPAPASFRFERLPLQGADPSQVQLELLASPALEQAGLRRDDGAPRYSVQVAGKTQRMISPYSDPYGWGGWGGWGFGGGRGGWGVGFHRPFGALESTWFHREVSIVVRELPGNRVVYETHATNDGPWRDSVSVLPAMFQAALQGFPTPPAGPRRVDIQIGGAAKPAS